MANFDAHSIAVLDSLRAKAEHLSKQLSEVTQDVELLNIKEKVKGSLSNVGEFGGKVTKHYDDGDAENKGGFVTIDQANQSRAGTKTR